VNKKVYIKYFIILALLLLIIIGLIWINYSYVITHPGANEFLARWNGVHQWLETGLSPYNNDSSRLSQQMAYGRYFKSKLGEDPLLFLYPFQAVLIYSPFAMMKYSLARTIWMMVNEIALVILGIVGLKLLDWKIKILSFSSILLGMICCYYSYRCIISGSIIPVCGLFLFLSLLLIKRRHDQMAGFLLVFALIKPQFSLLPVLFILIWAIRFARTRIWATFFLSLCGITSLGLILIPGWLTNWLRQVIRVIMDAGWQGDVVSTLAKIAPGITNQVLWVISISLYLYCLYEWLRNCRFEITTFYWGVNMTILLSLMISPMINSQHYIVLFPAILLIGKALADRLGSFGKRIASVILILIPTSSWIIYFSTRPTIGESHILLLPLPLFLLAGLWWSRWWVVRPPNRFTELE